MTKQEQLHKAVKIATRAHRGQTDRYGFPYIGHVLRVSAQGKTLDEKIVGALHDVVEDCPDYPLSYLKEKGFSEEILFAVECISKLNPQEPYDEFIRRIEKSPLAVQVKINDLKDNMNLTRCTRTLEESDLRRLNKYLKAYQYLIEKY